MTSDSELVGLGVGGVTRGVSKAVVGDILVPLDQVNVNTFLSMAAACASKKLLSLYEGLEAVAVALYAYGSLEEERIDWLEAEIEARSKSKDVTEELILDGFWRCPIMRFLKDKIRGVKVTLKG